MDIDIPKLQTKTLRRAADAGAYKLYRAAQEWELVGIRLTHQAPIPSMGEWKTILGT